MKFQLRTFPLVLKQIVEPHYWTSMFVNRKSYQEYLSFMSGGMLLYKISSNCRHVIADTLLQALNIWQDFGQM